jgi:hypothetical protein
MLGSSLRFLREGMGMAQGKISLHEKSDVFTGKVSQDVDSFGEAIFWVCVDLHNTASSFFAAEVCEMLTGYYATLGDEQGWQFEIKENNSGTTYIYQWEPAE